jgi:hypothetical protein
MDLAHDPPAGNATLAVRLCLIALLPACGSDVGEAGGSPLEVVRDTVGDTLVVRTVSGSAWGSDAQLVPEMSFGEMDGDLEYLLGDIVSLGVASDGTIYLVDGQVPELRSYDSNGRYVATLGGPGEGPGELNSPSGGLAVLSDDRVVIRDPGNSRLQVFDATGPTEAWPVVRGGFQSLSPLWWDREDNVYLFVFLSMEGDFDDWRRGLARIRSDGTAADTIAAPESGYKETILQARGENNAAMSRLPFAPAEETAIHPGGYYVHGISDRYAFTLLRDENPIRMERTAAPVPVAPGERSQSERVILRNMRRVEPGWSWSGPGVPEFKAPFKGLYMSREGRIWVAVPTPAVEERDPDHDPEEEGSEPTRWREPLAFDVFGEDGTYFGRAHAPDGFITHPTPVIIGDNVWAVTEDEMGVQRVVRFRIELDGLGM